MNKSNQFSPAVRERAVRMVQKHCRVLQIAPSGRRRHVAEQRYPALRYGFRAGRTLEQALHARQPEGA